MGDLMAMSTLQLLGMASVLLLLLTFHPTSRAFYHSLRLRNENSRVRARACSRLKTYGRVAIPFIRWTLRSSNRYARSDAMQLLWILEGESATRHIAHMLHDPDELVRCTALLMLGRIRDRATLPAISEAIQQNRFGLFWILGLEVMGDFGEEVVTPPILAELREIYGLTRDRVCVALGRLGQRNVASMLGYAFAVRAHGNMSEARAYALDALANLSGESCMDSVREALASSEEDQLQYILHAMRRLTSRLFPPGIDLSNQIGEETLRQMERWWKWGHGQFRRSGAGGRDAPTV